MAKQCPSHLGWLLNVKEQQLYSELLLGDWVVHPVRKGSLAQLKSVAFRLSSFTKTDQYSECITVNTATDPLLDLTLPRKQDLEIPEFINLWQVSAGGSCKWLQCTLEVLARLSQYDHISYRRQRCRSPGDPCLHIEIVSMKIMNRRGEKGQRCRSATRTGNSSNLQPAIWTRVLLCSHSPILLKIHWNNTHCLGRDWPVPCKLLCFQKGKHGWRVFVDYFSGQKKKKKRATPLS